MSSLNTPRPLSIDRVRDLAAEFHMELTDEEAQVFRDMINETLDSYGRLRDLTPSTPFDPVTEPRSGRHPVEEEDPCNAFVTRCTIGGDQEGPLTDLSVGLKDNIAVAGLPMTCGSPLFREYVPRQDATLVTRLLEAGVTIVGKLNMDNLAFSGTGEVTDTGPIHNPRDEGYLAGGSSGGAAAAVVTGDVDVAIGTDQAGSIRIPAAWCGCVGYKPTYGLVPYTGIVAHGCTFDHAGPLAKTTAHCRRTLEVIAGYDPLDPRQRDAIRSDSSSFDSPTNDDEIRVGVVEEGFDQETVQDSVAETVRNSLTVFAASDIDLESVSVSLHADGLAIWSGITIEETTALVQGEGVGHSRHGYYDTQFAAQFAMARRTRADEFPPRLKIKLILGQYLADHYHGQFHVRAQNLRRDLTAAYDAALGSVDVLAMPTVPQTASELEEEPSLEDVIRRGGATLVNTAPFNITGHPAISVPCGQVDGLPVGVMFIGRHSNDSTVLKVAEAFEDRVDWTDI